MFGVSDIGHFRLECVYRNFTISVIGDNYSPMKAMVYDKEVTHFNGEANKINFRHINGVIAKLRNLVDEIINEVGKGE